MPTAYRTDGAQVQVAYREEREGNRPPRRVFAITPEGEAAFQRMLRESLADYEPMVFSGNIGLLFLDAIPSGEAVELLRARRESVESLLQQARSHDVHGESSSVLLLHQTRHLATELEWLDEVIAQLESGPQGHAPGAGYTPLSHGHGEYQGHGAKEE